jgi:hypothetical protein
LLLSSLLITRLLLHFPFVEHNSIISKHFAPSAIAETRTYSNRALYDTSTSYEPDGPIFVILSLVAEYSTLCTDSLIRSVFSATRVQHCFNANARSYILILSVYSCRPPLAHRAAPFTALSLLWLLLLVAADQDSIRISDRDGTLLTRSHSFSVIEHIKRVYSSSVRTCAAFPVSLIVHFVVARSSLRALVVLMLLLADYWLLIIDH